MAEKDRTAAGVVASDAMIPPAEDENFRRREYPTLPVPPVGHARLWADRGRGVYALTYNGVDIITIRLPRRAQAQPKCHSDGNMQSEPFIQQFTISCDAIARATVEFFSPGDMLNMRARRAAAGEAILGQMGHPLIYGANAMYFADWDLLVSWHGLDFTWMSSSIVREKGGWHAAMEMKIGARPLVILLRPRYYGQHLGYRQHEPWRFKPNPKAVAGWCSWEAYHDDVTEDDIRASAKAIAPLKQFGLEYMQIDDGFQQKLVPMRVGGTVCESWLNTNEKFPGGHEAIVSAMRAGGFKPGVWTNATITNREGAKSMNCCVRKADGELLSGDWIHYVLDCSERALWTHVTPYYRALREMGYEYFKSDALRHLIYDGQQEAVRLGLIDSETASARQTAYMRAAREGIGKDAYYLSCWGALSQSIGIADAMRIGGDTGPKWCSYSMQIRESARWYFAQRIMFTLDPDVVCVRGRDAYVRTLLSLVSLMGGLYMISDKPETYDDTHLEMICRTLPPLTTCAAETGPVDYTTPACIYTRSGGEELCHDISHIDDSVAPFSSLWAFHMVHGGRSWCVVQRCAVIPLDAMVISADKLGLDPTREYYTFNFWAQRGSRVGGRAIAFPELALGETTVLALTDVTSGMPVLVGSSRHVSMDAVSVLDARQCLEGYSLQLDGPEGLECEYAIYAGPLRGRIVRAKGASFTLTRDEDLLRLHVKFSVGKAEIIIG